MYDYDDYEEDVLLVLRVLKYLHGVQTREEFLKHSTLHRGRDG